MIESKEKNYVTYRNNDNNEFFFYLIVFMFLILQNTHSGGISDFLWWSKGNHDVNVQYDYISIAFTDIIMNHEQKEHESSAGKKIIGHSKLKWWTFL